MWHVGCPRFPLGMALLITLVGTRLSLSLGGVSIVLEHLNESLKRGSLKSFLCALLAEKEQKTFLI